MVGVLHICMFTLMLFTLRKLCLHLATSVYMTLYLVLACDVDIPVFSVSRQEESVQFKWTTSGSLSKCVRVNTRALKVSMSIVYHTQISLCVPLFLSSTFLLPCHLCWALNIVCV